MATVGSGSPQVTSNVAIGHLDVGGGNVTITNTGALTATDGTSISSGSVSVNAGGVVNSDVRLDGGSLSIDGALNGKLTLNNGNVTVNGALGSAAIGTGTALSNNGAVNGVDVLAGGTFVNNSGATAAAVTNAGTTSNAGTIGNFTNTAGNFTNNNGGTVTGKTTILGGTVTNNFVITDADVAAAAAFVNNSGATAGAVRNSGSVTNAGTIASLENEAGSFTNNFGGVVAGSTNITGGSVTNNADVNNVNVGAGGTFTNASGATAGDVTNAGNTSNAGSLNSLTNTAGTFTNNTGGTITGTSTIDGGTVTNNFVITDADVAAVATFVNNSHATAGAVRNSGTVINAGSIASLRNDGGTFTNNAGGDVAGTTTVNGGNVVNNATLADVDIGTAGIFVNNSGAFAGTVTNAGISANDGTIAALANSNGIFSNTGRINGTATVTGGSLVNDGIAGAVDIGDGGLLSGNGSVGELFVNSGGVLAPGTGIGTVTVDGDLTFRAGSTYQLDIDASGRSDTVNATGAVSIQGGTLDILAAGGNYLPATSYTILSAGSITGGFDSVSSDFAFLSPTLSYGTTGIDVQLDRNGVQFADVAKTANGRAAAAAVQALGSGRSIYDTVLSLDSVTANSAFSQLSGEVHSSLKSAMLWNSRFTRQAILDEVTADPEGRTEDLAFWTAGFQASNIWSGNGNAASIDSHTAGGLFGADGPISDQWRVGGVVGYSHDTFQQANADSYHAGLYALGDLGPVNIVGGAIYSHNEASTRRSAMFGTFADRLTAAYASATSQVFGDLSWTYDMDPVTLQPFANLAYVNLDTNGFRETGGDAALSTTGSNDNAIATSIIGVRWSREWPENDLPIALSGMLGWRHLAGDVTPYSSLAFTGGVPFVVEGAEMPRDSLVARLGVSAKLSKSVRVTLSYSGEFGKGLHSNAAEMSVVANF